MVSSHHTPKEPADETALLDMILTILDDDKAEDVVTIDLRGKTALFDHMVIASGRSQRQVLAMADHLNRAIKAASPKAPPTEGLPQGDWVLIDAGDVLVHLFRPEVREFYNIEKMWSVDSPAVALRSS